MVLKDWTFVLELYTHTSSSLRKAPFVHRYWYVSIPAFLTVAFLSAFPWFLRSDSEKVWLGVLCFCLGAFFFQVTEVRKEKALAQVFKKEYENHGIARYPRSERRRYLQYALFLQGLIDKKYFEVESIRLKRIANIMGSPEPNFRLSQHPVAISFFAGLSSALLVVYIRDLEVLRGWGGAVWLSLFAGILSFLWLALGSFSVTTARRNYEIQLFLQWAELDIERGIS